MPLSAGKTYYFSMYVGCTPVSGTKKINMGHIGNRNRGPMVLGNIGVYFSQNRLRDFNNFYIPSVTPQIRFKTWPLPPADTFGYTHLTATYTASGGEQFMTIGNFDPYSQFKPLAFPPDSFYTGTIGHVSDTFEARYSWPFNEFLDDISLVRDTTQPMISLSEFSLGPDTTVCSGATIGGQPYFLSYLWNTGDTTRFIHVTQSGQYWCRVDFGCSTYTDTINVSIQPPPPPFHIPDTALCKGRPYIARAPKGYAAYAWSNGSGADSAYFYYPGRLWSRITDVCGQSYTDSFRLVNTPSTIPGININTHPPIVLCDGTPTRFVTNITGGGYQPGYQWYKNGVLLAGATDSTYLDSALVNGDTLVVALHSNAGCPVTQPTFSNHAGVTVYPNLPTAVSIQATPDSLTGGPIRFRALATNGGPNPRYQWFRNSLAVAFDTSDTYIVNDLHEGEFVSVMLESRAHCPVPALSFSRELIVRHGRLTLGAGTALQKAVRVYPNPVSGQVIIEGAAGAEALLLNSVGQEVLRIHISNEQQRVEMSVLPAGLYLLQLRSGDGWRQGYKLMKE
ncbi:MAG: T9SS type A sorting domain-containing protein [Bacteroidetes bacterium]|nr:T9SS type A sorting domain-containing protein [Bacteroidota bacterium]